MGGPMYNSRNREDPETFSLSSHLIELLSLKMDHPQFLCAALCLLSIFKSSIGADTLLPNQILADGEVLTSPGRIFELGFFSPGKSTNKFVGIWYKATPDVVVWVANRENPIMDSHGVLTLTRNGALIIRAAQGTIIWSSNSSRMAASSPVLKLLDNGNLVLSDNSSNIWQSFDYPSDTRLPGMKLVENPDTGEDKYLTSWKSADDPSIGNFSLRILNQGLSQVVILEGKQRRHRNTFWNGYFLGFPIVPDQTWKTEFESNGGRLVSVSTPFNDSIRSRLTMNYSGTLERYRMNERGDGWILMASTPHDLCENYGRCGYNGLCKIYKLPECECISGFKPKSVKEWDMFEWKSGCSRNLPLDCQKEDGFLMLERMKFPDSLTFQLNTSMSIHECRDECLKNCNCTAYADPYSGNGSSCLMWFGDLIDIREFDADSRPGPGFYVRVPVSELEHVTDWNETKKKGPAKTKIRVIAAVSSFGILLLGLCFGALLLKRRRKRQAYKKKTEELELPLFDLATIAAATKNFSNENLIGEGGFGPVYKGKLSAKQEIAVKRMSRTSGQGAEEFKNEVILIAKLQHRNLVRILGCCTEADEKMLIYEYMQNKSLDYFVFDQNRSALLTWPNRFDIIMEIARGLLYLHHDSRLKIIHRDLKTSNILLDENLNAKISDFGLARMFEGDQTAARTKRVVGTYGYIAPEYAFNGNFSVKSDIFSFGVVILEIVSGKKNRGFKHASYYHNLLEQAWLLWKERREMELMDPCYNSSYVESQVKRCIQVGLLCVQNAADDRPAMPSVLLMLSSEDSVLPQPRKPGYFLRSSSYSALRNASGSEASGCGAVTISEIEAR